MAAITIGFNRDRKPVTAGDLGVAGAMAVAARDALQPNLLQTTEHTPMIVHTGPFGNIAHGNSSVLADLVGLKLADYVVTESGFGADMGFEKFMDIKCRAMGLLPDAAVIVCTVRALKMHSGRFKIAAGKPLDPRLKEEDLESVEQGAANLEKHIENVQRLGVPAVVAINRFGFDSGRELELVRSIALRAGARTPRSARSGSTVARAAPGWRARSSPRPSPDTSSATSSTRTTLSIKDKIETIATEMYGARGVVYLPEAERQIRQYTALGLDKLPICMAKTQYSLSDNAP